MGEVQSPVIEQKPCEGFNLTLTICRITRFFESWLLLPDFCTHHPTLVSFLRIRSGSRPAPDPLPTRIRAHPNASRTSTRIAPDHSRFASLIFHPQGRAAFAAQWPPSLAFTRVGPADPAQARYRPTWAPFVNRLHKAHGLRRSPLSCARCTYIGWI